MVKPQSGNHHFRFLTINCGLKMIHRAFIILVVLNFLISCDHSKADPDIQCYAQYIAGISLLQYRPLNLNHDKQAVQLRKLQVVSGVTAQEVIAYLESIKNKPEKGLQLDEEMQRIFLEKKDSNNK
jgi:hypothetical protein